MTTPTHEYETVEGTQPTPHGVHEARTVKHVTNDDLYMMTEIGDGTFVQWSTCRKCSARVGNCTCAGGPQAPDFMERWRTARFDNELNARPDPSYDLIPALISWLGERGYDVTKSVKKQLAEAKPFDSATDVGIADLTDEEAQALDEALRKGEVLVELNVSPTLREDSRLVEEKVDQGLDAALDQVRAAKPEDFSDDF